LDRLESDQPDASAEILYKGNLSLIDQGVNCAPRDREAMLKVIA
jgi:hypothetical protein